jgi:RNase P/RNase MRP subunit p30
MTSKNINVSIHTDDIRRVADANLGHVLARLMSKYSNKVEDLGKNLQTESKEKILNDMADLISVLEGAIPEIAAIVAYVNEIEELPSTTDT